jgi:hypothetical protein
MRVTYPAIWISWRLEAGARRRRPVVGIAGHRAGACVPHVINTVLDSCCA